MSDSSDNLGCTVAVVVPGVTVLVCALVAENGAVALFTVVIMAFLLWVISALPGETPASSSEERAGSGQVAGSGLYFRATKVVERFEGEHLDSIKFEMRGLVAPKKPIYAPLFRITLTDVTPHSDGQGKPVLTFVDSLQAAGSTDFQFRQKLDRPLNAGSGLRDWVGLVAVPTEVLLFPARGERQIKAILAVVDTLDSSVATSAEAVLTVSSPVGYLELQETQAEAQAAALRLAMCLAAADGVVDDSEVAVIKGWGEKTVKSLDVGMRPERNVILNNALSDVTSDIRTGNVEQAMQQAIDVLNRIGEPRFKYDAYELCLEVLKADGEAHPEEMAQVTQLARRLKLDETKVRILTDRHTADVNFTVFSEEGDEDDQFLGITPDMGKEEIKRHLNKLFRKHSARSTHDDPKVASKAKEWLDRIGRARVRHLG